MIIIKNSMILNWKISKLTPLLFLVLFFFAAPLNSKTHGTKKSALLAKFPFQANVNHSIQVKQPIVKDEDHAFMLSIESSPSQAWEVLIQLENHKCTFKYKSNICVLENPPSLVAVRITCIAQPCKHDFVASSRLLISINSSDKDSSRSLTVPGQIYKLPEMFYNSILEIYSELGQVRLSSNKIVIYSNVHIFPLDQGDKLDTGTAVFGIKPISSGNGRYLYFESHLPVRMDQLKFQLRLHKSQIKQNVPILDFIETYGRKSFNQYIYSASVTKNINIICRIYAPNNSDKIEFKLKVFVKKELDAPEKTIGEILLSPVQFKQQPYLDLHYTISKSLIPTKELTIIQASLNTENQAVFIQLSLREETVNEVQLFDTIYFSSGKEELQFQVEPEVVHQLSNEDKLVPFITHADQKYSNSIETCTLKKGCTFNITAKEKCQLCYFSFQTKDLPQIGDKIYYQIKNRQIQGKIDFQQHLYFTFTLQPQQRVQIIVNTMNVNVYINKQDYKRCISPAPNCHELVINMQNPRIIGNTKATSQKIQVGVVGLETTFFKVRILNDTQGMIIKMGEKFAYLFDDQEQSITAKFVLHREDFSQTDESLTFNLISPVGSLNLTVQNEQGQTLSTLEGYITFDRNDIKGDVFNIFIKKTPRFKQQFVHMTLIISSYDYSVRLDSTITHYERYEPRSTKYYMIEYDSSQEQLLNVYTENLQKTDSKMKLTLRPLSAQDTEVKTVVKELKRDFETIDIDFQLAKIDLCTNANCEIQVEIQSISNAVLDQSITLYGEESIIMLDDSLWSTYQINDLSKHNHFYYYPRKNHSLTILFQSDDPNLYIEYIIYNTTSSPSPQDWPFQAQTQVHNYLPKSTQQFKISPDHPEIQKCEPNCVLLINVKEINQAQANHYSTKGLIQGYKLLVSSNIIELPEDTKLFVSMVPEQTDSMFILLKNFLKEQKLTFFTYISQGQAKVNASLVQNGVEYNFTRKEYSEFDQLETDIPIDAINQTMNFNHITDEDLMLKITFYAYSQVKMYIQFTTRLKSIYRLKMQDMEYLTLKQGEDIWYEIIPDRDYMIKFYRVKGFPFVSVFTCSEQDYVQCLTKRKQSLYAAKQNKLNIQKLVKDDTVNVDELMAKVKQSEISEKDARIQAITDKDFEHFGKSCQKCLQIVWIYCFQSDLQLSINVRPLNSQTQLTQMQAVNDQIDGIFKSKKYLISTSLKEDTFISFRIAQGKARVTVSDQKGILFNQTYNEESKDYEDILISGVLQTNQKETTSIKLKSRVLHVEVESQDGKRVEYFISYSISNNSLYLQDGVVFQKAIYPNIPVTLFYQNQDKRTHAYLTISSEVYYAQSNDKKSANEYKVKLFYYPDINNRKVKEQFKPQMPPKRNQQYLGDVLSHIYELPTKPDLFEIQVETKYYLWITIFINHKELVYLPLNYEYVIKIRPQQPLNLVFSTPSTEQKQLELTVKKCDESSPTLLYTNDAKEFKLGIFSSQVELTQSIYKQKIIPKNTSKTIHLKLVGDETQPSVLSVSMRIISDLKQPKFKAGNSGILTYNSVQSSKVQIFFNGVVCEDHKSIHIECPKQINYYLIVSQSPQVIYQQLNCAANYFVPQAQKLINMTQSAQVILISPTAHDPISNTYKYSYSTKHQHSYVTVKAIVRNKQNIDVPYVPIQITSFWTQLSKISISLVALFSFALAALITIVIIVSTKLARRGYRPISMTE